MSQHEGDCSDDSLSATPSSNPNLKRFLNESQPEFERRFFENTLARCPNSVDVLRVLGHLYTEMGLYSHGLNVDRRLVRLLPADPTVHYNLACSCSLLHMTDEAFESLRQACQLGYYDFEYMKQDTDLDPVRSDPRFGELLADFDPS